MTDESSSSQDLNALDKLLDNDLYGCLELA